MKRHLSLHAKLQQWGLSKGCQVCMAAGRKHPGLYILPFRLGIVLWTPQHFAKSLFPFSEHIKTCNTGIEPLWSFFSIWMYICGDVPTKGPSWASRKHFWRAPDKVHPEGAVETKAQVQEAKELVSETRLFPHSTFFSSENIFHAFRIHYGLKKIQTSQCNFLIIKREKKVCDEKVKDGIINDTGGSLSPGNQKW